MARSQGLFNSLNLLFVLSTLVSQISASPLPISVDTAMLYERNSLSKLSSFNSSSFNWEYSEVTSRNERRHRADENLFLGVGFVGGHVEQSYPFPFEEIKIPWKGGLKSKDLYLLPNTKLAKSFMDNAKFKASYHLCIVYGSNLKVIKDTTKVYTTYEMRPLAPSHAHVPPPTEVHSGNLPAYHETSGTHRLPSYELLDSHPPYTTTEPSSIGENIVFARNMMGPEDDIVMRIPQVLWQTLGLRVLIIPRPTSEDKALDAKWQQWQNIHGWPEGLKVRGDSEDDNYV